MRATVSFRMTGSASLVMLLGLPGVLFAQGSLTPPGAPLPTMKTLEQVEPRMPVSEPLTITQPGSYYLTTNLGGTVTIAADNVTLDLMGFTLAPSSGNAINQSGARKNLRIHNGAITAPAGSGINFDASVSNANGVIEGVRVSACQFQGIRVGGGYTVRNCQVYGAGTMGISVSGASAVRDCRSEGCGTGLYLTGSGALVDNNIVRGNADNYNIMTLDNQLNLLLCEVPESFSWPCSVRFAGTLKMTGAGDGIGVFADNVTIDLAGHALVGPGVTSGHGISHGTSYRNLRVMNGLVVGWCGVEKAGVYAASPSAILRDLQVMTNYCGIVAGDGGTVSGCAAERNANDGFRLSYNNAVSGCAAYMNGSHGFSGTSGSAFAGCTAGGNASNGFDVIYAGNLTRCAAYKNSANGFSVGGGGLISECTARENTANGIKVSNASTVLHCSSYNNGNGGDGAGFFATGADNRIEGNNATSNDRGFDIAQAGNFITRNIASANTTNWTVVVGNVCLVVNATVTSGAINGNSGGTAPGSTDPNANFTY